MSARRERILAELELGPRWRLRARPVAEQREAHADEPGVVARETEEAPARREATTASLDLDDRPTRIARMDWAELKSTVAACKACELCRTRTQTVFGVGDERAEWLIVGEAPGAEEDARGEPFVGQAGRLLDSMLAALDLRRGENVYIANVLKCLRYNAPVQLADGSWERVGRLVRSRYDGCVMSVDATGRLVPRRVIGWHESPLGDRRVFRLTYGSAKNAGRNPIGVQLTGDHEVMTQRGFIAVERLEPGDRIATGQGLSRLAFDVVCGTLLGDGHIATSRTLLSFGHSTRQRDYALFKARLLAELGPQVGERFVAAVVGGPKAYPVVQVYTRAHRALRILRGEFYTSSKRVPPWIDTGLNERMLAFWFMDDGYMRIRAGRQPLAEIATCGFPESELSALLTGLSRLGLEATSRHGRLHFDVANSRALSERVAPYVPPLMRYKLHPEVAEGVRFDPDRLRPGPSEVLYDEVQVEDVTEQPRTDRTFFCIDVEETHNFVTSGGVVHNCRPPGNRNPEPFEVAQCAPHLVRQIELIRPQLILAMGRAAAQTLLNTEASIASLRGRVFRYQGVPTIVSYHPAYLLRNLPDKAKAWEDLCFARATMRELKTADAPRA